MKITMELANEINTIYGLPSVDRVLAMVNGKIEPKPQPQPVAVEAKPVKVSAKSSSNKIVTKMQGHMAKVRKALSHHKAEKETIDDFFKDLS